MMKRIIIALLFACLLLTFVSCGTGKDFEETTVIYKDPHGRQVVNATYIENIGEYTVVRSDTSSNTVKTLATELRTAISDFAGTQLKIGTDYGSKSEFEILLGSTNRPESKRANEGLGHNDYIIKLDGTKIVIAAGSEATLKIAIDEFLANFMFDSMVVVPDGEGLRYSPSYKFDVISIDGRDISEFKVYSENADASNVFATKISGFYSGQIVEVAENMDGSGSFIVLEPTSIDYASYKAEIKDGNLYVSGSYKSCTDFLDYFVKKGEKNVNIKSGFEGKLDAPKTYNKEQLMSVLATVYDENTAILGEQVNSYGGELGTPSDVLKRFYKATGKYPGMVAVDIGGYGLKLTGGNCPDMVKSQVLCEFVEFAEMGGVVQLHSHMVMPKEEWDPENEIFRSVLGKDPAIWESLLTEGTALNENFNRALDIEAEYLKLFAELGVPVLWRPFHEMNANWFWWGVSQDGKTIDASCFTNMWQYMHNRFTEQGLDNLVWVYSPNNANGWIDVMYTYPGDDYVDIVGLDWYTEGGYEIDGSGKSYAKLMSSEKITNVCEFGISPPIQVDDRNLQKETFSCLDFEAMIKQMFSDGYKMAYILTWTAQDSVDWWGYGEEMMAGGTFLDRDTLLTSYFSKAN